MEEQATKAMEAARSGVLSKHPSLGYLSFKLKWFADPACKTAWTDGISVGFNPEFVMSLNREERRFLCAHELGHPMLGHHLRRDGRDPKKWNVACDYVVNLILLKQGIRPPKGALIDHKFTDMAVEQVFNSLFPPGQDDDDSNQDSTERGQNGDSSPSTDEEGPGDQNNDKDSSNGKNDGSGSQGGEGDDKLGSKDRESGQENKADQGTEQSDNGRSGGPTNQGCDRTGADQGSGTPSGAGDSSGGNPVDRGPGEVRDFPGVTDEDVQLEEQKWSVAIQQAAQISRKIEGNVPGFVETLLTDAADPKLPWQQILSRWLTTKAKNDYSWTTPNPRYSSTGFFMPSLESQELGKLAIFWDTSCSVTDDQAADIGSETQGILQYYPGVTIDLYHIDTAVRHMEEIDKYTKWGEISAIGRGGTDFRPGFEALEESTEEAPVGVIYMTDGECSSFPDEAPHYPVLWIVVDMPYHKRFEPPFGEVAYYNDF